MTIDQGPRQKLEYEHTPGGGLMPLEPVIEQPLPEAETPHGIEGITSRWTPPAKRPFPEAVTTAPSKEKSGGYRKLRTFGKAVLLVSALYVNRSGGEVDAVMGHYDDTPIAERIMGGQKYEWLYGLPPSAEVSEFNAECAADMAKTLPGAADKWLANRNALSQKFDDGLQRVARIYTIWDEQGKDGLLPLRDEFMSNYGNEIMPKKQPETFTADLKSAQTSSEVLNVMRQFSAFYGISVVVDKSYSDIDASQLREVALAEIEEFGHLPKSLFVEQQFTQIELVKGIDRDGTRRYLNETTAEAYKDCGPSSIKVSVQSFGDPIGPEFMDRFEPVGRFILGERNKIHIMAHEFGHLHDPNFDVDIYEKGPGLDLTLPFEMRLLHYPDNVSNYASSTRKEKFAEHFRTVLMGHLVKPNETRLIRSDMNRQLVAALANLEVRYPNMTAYLATLEK